MAIRPVNICQNSSGAMYSNKTLIKNAQRNNLGKLESLTHTPVSKNNDKWHGQGRAETTTAWQRKCFCKVRCPSVACLGELALPVSDPCHWGWLLYVTFYKSPLSSTALGICPPEFPLHVPSGSAQSSETTRLLFRLAPFLRLIYRTPFQYPSQQCSVRTSPTCHYPPYFAVDPFHLAGLDFNQINSFPCALCLLNF